MISKGQVKRVLIDLTLSLIYQVSEMAKNSLSMGTCSIVKWLGSEWTQVEWKAVWGQQNGVECPLTGSCIVSGSDDKSVQVWDALSSVELKLLNGHTDSVKSVAFSSDGTHIVSGSNDKSVQVWDALSGVELRVLNGHTEIVWSVAFSSDGTHIVSGSFDKSV